MQFGSTCCLDKAGNGICDRDEGLLATNTSENHSYKYVCSDGSVTDHPTKCSPIVAGANVKPVEPTVAIIPSAPQVLSEEVVPYEESVVHEEVVFDPYDEQDATYINRFDVTSVCRGSFNAAELFFDLSQTPERIGVEILEDPDGRFRDIGSAIGAGETYFYIGFCQQCEHMTDAQLPAGTYLVRGALTYGDRTVYTREYVVDTREYTQRNCA
jgi:hypothetical protein